MCKKCWDTGRMASSMILTEANEVAFIQFVDGKPVTGALVGMLEEQTIEKLEEFTKKLREHMTLAKAANTGNLH